MSKIEVLRVPENGTFNVFDDGFLAGAFPICYAPNVLAALLEDAGAFDVEIGKRRGVARIGSDSRLPVGQAWLLPIPE